ncbi:MAG: 30S ribosomal protein S16 [Bacteroidales bacterium]
MPVRIRLQRHGKKGSPFFQIVVADGRAPRDGKFIEKIGTYNPMKNPAEIKLDIDKSVQWMRNGAQPSDTVRSLLSRQGAMLKHHLLKGVDKGALTAEQAEVKFQAWVVDKEARLQKVSQAKDAKQVESLKARLEAESKVKEAKASAIAAKKSEALQAVKAAEAKAAEAETPTTEEVVAEPVAQTTEG